MTSNLFASWEEGLQVIVRGEEGAVTLREPFLCSSVNEDLLNTYYMSYAKEGKLSLTQHSGSFCQFINVYKDPQARWHISGRVRGITPGEEFFLTGEIRENVTERVTSELERTSRQGNLCEQRTRDMSATRNALGKARNGACLAPGYERARKQERE